LCSGTAFKPKLRLEAASAVVTAFQPDRPPLAWSSVAKRLAML
jgi:hypothetical protein